MAAGAEIRFRAPTRAGDVLVATAVERCREGRDGTYDVTVTAGETVVATFVGSLQGDRRRLLGPARRKGPDMAGEIPTPTRAELEALQLDRLRDTLRRAHEHVPHYRRAFDRAGVTPDDLHTLADLARFPFTTKADLRDELPVRHVRGPARAGRPGAREQRHHRQADRGRLHRGDLDTWSELMARSIRAAGGRPGDLVHVAYGYGLFTGGLGAHYGAERLGCTVVPVSGGMTERQVQLIVDFRPRVIMVTPSYFLAILDEMEAQGVDPRSTSLEVGIFGAEPWTDEMRRAVEERSGRPGRRHLRAVGGDGAGRLARSRARPRTGCTSGRTTSCPRSSTRSPTRCCPTARRASWSSPR